MVAIVQLKVKQRIGKKTGNKLNSWAIFAGVSELSRPFKSIDLALDELKTNRSHYEYWAGSAGVSVENTTPVIIKV